MSFLSVFGNKAYDVAERQTSYDINMDVPGVHPSDIDISVHDGGRLLRLSVKNYKLNGRVQAAALSHDFKLDERCVHINRISCILANGTLRVSIPKKSKEEMNKTWQIPLLAEADLWRSDARLTSKSSRRSLVNFDRTLKREGVRDDQSVSSQGTTEEGMSPSRSSEQGNVTDIEEETIKAAPIEKHVAKKPEKSLFSSLIKQSLSGIDKSDRE
mmetsp:Transcript_19189/g.27322  ORF Transcript_19189/g.27322 Transcript_19189/m.27322 type:complete len:214 (+) Transcript_19189:288-929(+)|eukprot:CAMPEP_0172425634 /NCGR_PEP_ID=MMETSP1064-20121228/33170_1 /TAXON_ID=202472 /ORGANISM="Aulacoseira subarctica , Strain CCAP 1002/5" /LENGTH=213 /DNA_ID=CAMNT_0013168677 /DNA_START=195 /DNA_END=836 /DNA_ORIENTATION=-